MNMREIIKDEIMNFALGTCGGRFSEEDIREFVEENEFDEQVDIDGIIDEVEFIAEFGF
jgi:hypothetical protein